MIVLGSAPLPPDCQTSPSPLYFLLTKRKTAKGQPWIGSGGVGCRGEQSRPSGRHCIQSLHHLSGGEGTEGIFFNDKDINIYIYDAKRTRSSVGLLKAELCCASPSAEYFALCFFFLKERGF